MEEFDFFNLEDLKLGEGTIEDITKPLVEDISTKEEDKTVEGLKTETENNEDKNKNDEKNKIAPSSESENDSSTFSVFANLLKEEGVISLDEEELKDLNFKDTKDLVELVKRQIEKSRFENLSESQKRYLEAVEAGLPQKDFEKIEKQLNQLEAIDENVLESNQQARFDIIAYDWMERGISKEKAVELANRSIKLGTDKEDAQESLQSLIKIKSDQYKNLITSKKEENRISLDKLKEVIDSKEVILKDVKVTPKFKTDLYNLLSTKVDTDEIGQPLNELNKWRQDNKLEAEIILGALYLQTNKFQNLGKILDSAKSKSALELEKKLKQMDMTEMNNGIFTSKDDKFTINI